jgi:hypothetical protein
MPITPYIQTGVFDAETIALMSEAFVAATKELRDGETPQVLLEVVAGRIVTALAAGERDPVRLLAAALAGLPREGD